MARTRLLQQKKLCFFCLTFVLLGGGSIIFKYPLDVVKYTSWFIEGVEIHHIGFLKVHKAASSTIQNIFLRFALDRNLALVLPNVTNYFSKSSEGHNELLPLPTGSSHYDMLACHSVYNQRTYSNILPNDAVYVGVVRNPLALMVSAAYYFRDAYKISYLLNVPADNFISNLIRLDEKQTFSFTKNSMAKDFGFTEEMAGDMLNITRYLKHLNENFGLVMVVEEFDASLIMMRRLLKWQLKDILYIVNNRHNYTPFNVSSEEEGIFRKRNALDNLIYNFFRRELERKISIAGFDFQREVLHFRAVEERVSDHCLNMIDSNTSDVLLIEKSAWNADFNVTRHDCELMSMGELDFLQLHRNLVLNINK